MVMEDAIRKSARLTPDQRKELTDQVTAMYRNGVSIRAISEETGRSYGNVHRLLVEAEVELRGRGGRTTPGLSRAKQRDYLDRLRETNPVRRKLR